MLVRQYTPAEKDEVIALWQESERANSYSPLSPLSKFENDIERKIKVNPELFLVGEIDGKVMATAMCGYDGHRGWVYYFIIFPAFQRKGYGRQMMNAVEKRLSLIGCPRIKLQVDKDNLIALRFYENIGFKQDDIIEMSKRISLD